MGGTHKMNPLRVRKFTEEGKMGRKALKFDRLTEKQELVALDVALGKRKCDIARQRGISTVSIALWGKYHKLFQKAVEKFKEKIQREYIEKEIDYAGVLDEIIREGKKHGANPAEVIQAAREAAKMRGKYEPEKVEVDIIASADDDRLDEIIAQGTKNTGSKGSSGKGKKASGK